MNEYRTLEIKYVGNKEMKDVLSYGELCIYRESWILNCPRCGAYLKLRIGYKVSKKHTVISVKPVHIEPSIICPCCKAHFYVRKGKVVII